MSKKLFSRLALLALMGLTAVSCSQMEDTQELSVEAQQKSEDGMYHYKMQLDCAMPSFDNNGQTRAVTYDKWENNQMLNIRFKNGSNWITGQAVYSKAENIWNVGTYSTLPTTTGEETCEVYYFYQSQGSSSTQINMNEQTACYMTKSGKYSHPTANSISMNAVLGKMTWRLRFKGTAGTSITLPSNENDINFFSAFNFNTGNFTSGKKDVSLTVASDGYTPYVYGTYANNGSNELVVRTDNTYKRTITTSQLAVGESAFLTAPTSSNHAGWETFIIPTPVLNCTIKPLDMVVFQNGFTTDWEVSDNVSQSFVTVFIKSFYDEFNGDESKIIAEIKEDNTSKNYTDFVTTYHSNFFTPGEEYVLCTISQNKDGKDGELVSVPFTTCSTSLPVATLSNLTATTYQGQMIWSWKVNLANSAKAYYMFATEDEDIYAETNDYYLAWLVHYWITSKQLTATYNYANPYISRSGNYFTVITWADDSKGGLGYYSIAKASSSSSARQMTTPEQRVRNGKPIPIDNVFDKKNEVPRVVQVQYIR